MQKKIYDRRSTVAWGMRGHSKGRMYCKGAEGKSWSWWTLFIYLFPSPFIPLHPLSPLPNPPAITTLMDIFNVLIIEMVLRFIHIQI